MGERHSHLKVFIACADLDLVTITLSKLPCAADAPQSICFLNLFWFFICTSLLVRTENVETVEHWASSPKVFGSHFTVQYHLDMFTLRQISSVCCGSWTSYLYLPLSLALRIKGLKQPDTIQWYRKAEHESSTCRSSFKLHLSGVQDVLNCTGFTCILSALV